MRILYAVRWFGNYKVPVFKNMLDITKGNFYVIYSKDAVTEEVHNRLQKALGGHAIPMENEKHIIIGSKESNFANRCIDITWQNGLMKKIDEINPDVIISDGFFQWSLPAIIKSRGRKFICFYERTAYVERNAPKWRTIYRKIIGRFIDGFIINGELTKEYVKQLGFGHLPMAEHCMVADVEGLTHDIENLTNEEKKHLRQELDINDKGITYLFVGQLVERKGVIELLEAWKEHIKNFVNDNLIIVGQGVLRDKIESQYSGINGLRIMGGVKYADIYKYYAITDVFVMPTLEDNWSLVVPEAMACGLPVSTTIYNGCYKELINEGINGYSFDPLNKEDTIDMLSKFHSSNLPFMGMMSKKIVSNFTPMGAAERMMELCKKVMEP